LKATLPIFLPFCCWSAPQCKRLHHPLLADEINDPEERLTHYSDFFPGILIHEGVSFEFRSIDSLVVNSSVPTPGKQSPALQNHSFSSLL
jgi:hypothetical protein